MTKQWALRHLKLTWKGGSVEGVFQVIPSSICITPFRPPPPPPTPREKIEERRELIQFAKNSSLTVARLE